MTLEDIYEIGHSIAYGCTFMAALLALFGSLVYISKRRKVKHSLERYTQQCNIVEARCNEFLMILLRQAKAPAVVTEKVLKQNNLKIVDCLDEHVAIDRTDKNRLVVMLYHCSNAAQDKHAALVEYLELQLSFERVDKEQLIRALSQTGSYDKALCHRILLLIFYRRSRYVIKNPVKAKDATSV